MRDAIKSMFPILLLAFSTDSVADICSADLLPEMRTLEVTEDVSVNPFSDSEEASVLDRLQISEIDKSFCGKILESVESPKEYCSEVERASTCMSIALDAGITPKGNIMHSSNSVSTFSELHRFLRSCLSELLDDEASRIFRSGEVERVYSVDPEWFIALRLEGCSTGVEVKSQLIVESSKQTRRECNNKNNCIEVSRR